MPGRLRLSPGSRVYLEGHAQTYGSLAHRVKNQQGQYRLLTASHVVSVRHGPTSPKTTVCHATVSGAEFVIGNLDLQRPSPVATLGQEILPWPPDAALVVPKAFVAFDRRIDSVVKVRSACYAYDDDLVGLRVFMSGAASGVHSGLVASVADSVNLFKDSKSMVYKSVFSVMSDQESHRFAQPGDSGALVLSQEGCVLGIVVGADDTDDPSGLAYVLPMDIIITAMQVTT